MSEPVAKDNSSTGPNRLICQTLLAQFDHGMVQLGHTTWQSSSATLKCINLLVYCAINLLVYCAKSNQGSCHLNGINDNRGKQGSIGSSQSSSN